MTNDHDTKLWCPYCGACAATYDGIDLRCEACGLIADIDYDTALDTFGTRKAKLIWRRYKKEHPDDSTT